MVTRAQEVVKKSAEKNHALAEIFLNYLTTKHVLLNAWIPKALNKKKSFQLQL
jgi:hypothetical protein